MFLTNWNFTFLSLRGSNEMIHISNHKIIEGIKIPRSLHLGRTTENLFFLSYLNLLGNRVFLFWFLPISSSCDPKSLGELSNNLNVEYSRG